MYTITECAAAVVAARKAQTGAVDAYTMLERTKGMDAPETKAFEPQLDATHTKVAEAEQRLANTPSRTLAEFARKVSLLCEERAEEETLDAIRKEAERLLQPTKDPVVYECRQWLNLRETQEALVIDNDGDSPELAEVTAELFAVERRLLALVPTSPEGVALLATVLWESEGPTAALGSPDYLRQLNSPEHQFLRRLRHGACRVAGFNTDRPDYFAA